jgi:hypothetical protein
MAAAVDWDLPCFGSLDEAIDFVAARGGGVVYWPGLADLDRTTMYAQGMIAEAKRRGVELRAKRVE